MSKMLILFTCCFAGRAQVLVESSCYLHQRTVLLQQEFSIDSLQRRAKEFLEMNALVPFAKLEMSVGDGARFYGSKGSNHVDATNYFYRLAHVYPDGVEAYGNIASVLKYGRQSVLRVRQDGMVKIIDVENRSGDRAGFVDGMEVLHLAPLFAFEKVSGVELFVRTSELATNEPRLTKFARDLWKLCPEFEELRVFSRKDWWFITHPLFPFIYAYDSPTILPTPLAYSKTSELMVRYPPR